MSLVWCLDRVTQVVMDGLLSFPFCGKKGSILNMLGRIPRSYELYAHGICFIIRLHRWNEYFLCSHMGTNRERIMDQMASRLSVWPQVSFIENNRYIRNWILFLCLSCGSTICYCLFAVNILNFSRPRLTKFSKLRKQLFLLLRLRVRRGRCCVHLL